MAMEIHSTERTTRMTASTLQEAYEQSLAYIETETAGVNKPDVSVHINAVSYGHRLDGTHEIHFAVEVIIRSGVDSL